MSIVETLVATAVEAALEPLIAKAGEEVVIKLTAEEADLLKKTFAIAEPLEDWLKKEVTGFIAAIKAKA